MNNFRNFVGKVAAQGAKMGAESGGPAPGGGGGGPAAALASSLFFMGLGGYGIYKSVVTVQPGHQGIIYNRFGGLNETAVLREGMNFVVPWFQRAIVYDIRTRPQPIDTTSGSKGDNIG